ncbi:hypothetical protein BC826DRAFT_650998 [Russula brevipes]|nr:hypothetical protein BC826DRAFT_650998 [Russula brevipes]
MVTGLSALTRLSKLSIQFQSPRSRPDQPAPPSAKKTWNDQPLSRAWSPILGACQAGQSDGYGQPGDPGHTVLVSMKNKE